jgi:hypothetical protein
MKGARIRWSRVARLAAGVGAGALGLAVLPGLLAGPEPPRLPPDVGLGPLSNSALQPAGRRGRPPGPEADRAPRTPPQTREPSAGRKDHGAPKQAAERRRPGVLAPAGGPPPAPAPPRSAPPPATPAPAATTPPAPEPPAPAPAPAPVSGQASVSSQAPAGPSEFGFEH